MIDGSHRRCAAGDQEAKATPTILVRKGGTTAKSYGPARGYSWPPFEKDNLAVVTYGAFSPRLIAARAAEIRKNLFERCPALRLPTRFHKSAKTAGSGSV